MDKRTNAIQTTTLEQRPQFVSCRQKWHWKKPTTNRTNKTT